VLFRAVAGQDDDLDVGRPFLDHSDRFHAILVRHTQIDQYDIRMEIERDRDCLKAIARLPDYDEALVAGLDHGAKTLPEQ